ncbi:DUF4064 domain-containing protein [Terribacillus saccharophilus]|uniref:DUF4064 domain-containing protein n=1 Tax=Terribacillus saccharophilus TaxID=361277 RepID=UPI002989E8B7|nr:DUF4064 domain-containing protein [Terribacillus saccharophilus]MCM3225631.1 DUF4064 domain-containing protein [Terribacillus saccharophilus]
MKTPKTLTMISLVLLTLIFIASLFFTITLPQNQSMEQAVTRYLENDPKYQRTLDTVETPSISADEMAAETMSALQVFFVIPTIYIAIIALIVLIGYTIIPKKPKGAALTLFSAGVLSLVTIIVPVLLFIAGGMLKKRSV